MPSGTSYYAIACHTCWHNVACQCATPLNFGMPYSANWLSLQRFSGGCILAHNMRKHPARGYFTSVWFYACPGWAYGGTYRSLWSFI